MLIRKNSLLCLKNWSNKKGWDFLEPIREDYDKDINANGNSGDPRKIRRMNELKKICEAMDKKEGPFVLQDLQKVVEDMEDYDRYTRRLKELENMGVVKKHGRGQYATYKLNKELMVEFIK